MVRIQLEYKWDIVNNLDGFFIRISLWYPTCEYKMGYSEYTKELKNVGY